MHASSFGGQYTYEILRVDVCFERGVLCAIFLKFVNDFVVPRGWRPSVEVMSRAMFDFRRGCGMCLVDITRLLDKVSTDSCRLSPPLSVSPDLGYETDAFLDKSCT